MSKKTTKKNPSPQGEVKRTTPLSLNEGLTLIKRCERLFKSAARAWENGNNSGESEIMDAETARCDRLRNKAEKLLAPLGIECDYPGLYPSFKVTTTAYGRAQVMNEYSVQGAVSRAMEEIERQSRTELIAILDQMTLRAEDVRAGHYETLDHASFDADIAHARAVLTAQKGGK